MREVNFLNRRTRQLLFLILLVTQLGGVSTFVYSWRERRFRPSLALRIYSVLVLSLVFMLDKQNNWPFIGACMMLVLACRLRGIWTSQDIPRLLNESLEVMAKVSAVARHPNIFRLRHLLLLVLGLQNLLRSLHMLVGISNDVFGSFAHGLVLFLLTFLLQITIHICLFVALIAKYSELHRCTRRITQDLDSLQRSRVLESGQFLLLVEQLQAVTQRLIQLRARTFQLTLRSMEHFRMHWLCAFIYGMMPCCFVAIHRRDFYYLGLSALNVTFHCTLFRILSWESRTTRSFSHFQMSSYHKDFDRTIDVLLHQEVRERLEVSIYGVTLDTKFLLKLLSTCAFWVCVNRQGYLLLHRNIV